MKKLSTTEINTLTETKQKSLRVLKERLAEKFRLRQLILFGSKARGDFEKWSDIDVLVLISN